MRVNAIVESTIKSIDITAITWKSDESTDQTELINRELPGLRVKYFPLLIFFSLSVFIDSIGVLIIYTHTVLIKVAKHNCNGVYLDPSESKSLLSFLPPINNFEISLEIIKI